MTFLDEELPSLNSWSGATPGPNALPSDRRKTGEINDGKHYSRYWKFSAAFDCEYLDHEFDFEFVSKATRFIHLFGSTKIHLREIFGGVSPSGLYLYKICRGQ